MILIGTVLLVGSALAGACGQATYNAWAQHQNEHAVLRSIIQQIQQAKPPAPSPAPSQ